MCFKNFISVVGDLKLSGPSVEETTAVISDDEIIEVVGPILEAYDVNNDGYIEYSEYILKKNKEN